MNDKKDKVRISKAKGRPMLTWVGKRPLTSVRAYPAQLARLVCPIGLSGIRGKQPATIALSLAAQLMTLDNDHGLRTR